jgi:hypothetical protein
MCPACVPRRTLEPVSTRNTYYVSPEGQNWKVTKEGGIEISRHQTQRAAIRFAVDEAYANPPSQVLVQGEDGQFRTEWTYGKDPYPPPG